MIPRNMAFEIRVEEPFEEFSKNIERKITLKKCDDEKRLLSDNWVDKDLVIDLWKQKDKLEESFNIDKGKSYYKVRDELFPLCKRGSSKYMNRAGDKFEEINDMENFVYITKSTEIEKTSFLDLCGGPGAWSQLLLKTHYNGYGITLMTADKNLQWYSLLKHYSQFSIVNGIKENGDICDIENCESFKKSVQKVDLVVADGGFKSDTINENYQELYCGKLLFFEIYNTLNLIKEQGNFLCKLFDTFSNFSVSMIYILTQVFGRVVIVKPPHSRSVNSERYIVCKGFSEEKYNSIVKYMNSIAKILSSSDKTPETLIKEDIMINDKKFYKSIRKMNKEIILIQIDNLKQILEKL